MAKKVSLEHLQAREAAERAALAARQQAVKVAQRKRQTEEARLQRVRWQALGVLPTGTLDF